jgi:hypothetical protein
MRSNRLLVLLCLALAGVASRSALANDWVYGNVSVIDDYSSYGTGAGDFQLLITLTNKNFSVPAHASQCTDRFRAVIGMEGMTEEVKKRVFAMMLTAYVTGARVRLFYNVSGAPHCTIQLASIGDLGS